MADIIVNIGNNPITVEVTQPSITVEMQNTSGEVTGAYNSGDVGTGIFIAKEEHLLRFAKLNSPDNTIDITYNDTDRVVELTVVPINIGTSELTNDAGFITASDISNKVDKIEGKGLSTEDYTTSEKNKLTNISAGAEVNVNADWDAVSGDAEILHKPDIPTKLSDLENDLDIGSDVFSLVTDDTIKAGQPLYIKTSGHVALANSNSISQAKIIGLAINDAEPSFLVDFKRTYELVINDWTNVIGTQYLQTGFEYYLDNSNAGMLTSNPPINSGDYSIKVGVALNNTTLMINIQILILL